MSFHRLSIIIILLIFASCKKGEVVYEISDDNLKSGSSADKVSPVASSASSIIFTDTYDNDGENILLSWDAFSDNLAVVDYAITLYTDDTCSSGKMVLGRTGSSSPKDNGLINALAEGTYYAIITGFDAAGNWSNSECSSDFITVDKTAPKLSSIGLLNQSPTKEEAINFLVEFDEEVQSVILSDFIINTTGDVSYSSVTISGSGMAWNIEIAGIIGSGELELDFKDAGHDVKDAAGNTADKNNISSDYYIIDNTPLEIVSISRVSSEFTNAPDIHYSVEFNKEIPAAPDISDFTIETVSGSVTATISNVNDDGDQIHYTVGISSVSGNGVIRLDFIDSDNSVRDALLNTPDDFISGELYTIDNTPPTDSSVIVLFNDTYDNDGNDIVMSWNQFNDANGVTDHQIRLYTDSNCSTGEIDKGLTGHGDPGDYAIVDSIAEGTYYATVTAFDGAGNETTSNCSSDSIIVDTTSPQLTSINLADANPTNAASINFEITFDESVQALTSSDFSINTTGSASYNTSAINITGSGMSWNVELTGITGTGDITVDYNDGDDSVQDIAGNIASKNGVSSATYNIDNSPFVVNSIIKDNASPTNSNIIRYSVQFNKIVQTSVQTSDFVVTKISGDAAGTVSSVTDDGDKRNFTVTINSVSGDGELRLDFIDSDDSVEDAIANTPVDFSIGETYLIDNSPPVDSTANVQFTDSTDSDGNNILMSWTAFSDNNAVIDHEIRLYTDNVCSIGEINAGRTGSTLNSDNGIVDSISPGKYYAKVTAFDAAGNHTTSQCSTDYIVVTTPPPPGMPAGSEWITVPANAGGMGLPSFVVMKYEARAWNDSNYNNEINTGEIHPSGDFMTGGPLGSSFKPLSDPRSYPWVRIQPGDAAQNCEDLGDNYYLISNIEWMAIARDIESVATNWSGGTVGSGMINRGHSDTTPGTVDLLTISNSSDGYNNTGNSASDLIGSGWEQKRTHTLSNGEEIWDLAGNALEWVDWNEAVSGFQTGPETCSTQVVELDQLNCNDLTNDDYNTSNGGYNSTNGVGKYRGYLNNKGAASRGGMNDHGDTAGIFYLSLNDSINDIANYLGFRCVYRP